jgi:hypothetical protein
MIQTVTNGNIDGREDNIEAEMAPFFILEMSESPLSEQPVCSGSFSLGL